MPAILFGSISTLADTSELQRQAFNEAFRAHGLDWDWDQEDYRGLLVRSGGQSRVDEYAQSRGETVDAQAIHETKSRLFQERLAAASPTVRPGVLDTIRAAKSNGWKLGLVTTTSGANVTALLDALSAQVQREDFDVIVDSASVGSVKPDMAAYTFALEQLDEVASRCVAIEDNADGVSSAVAAGLTCIAFPNENTSATVLAGAAVQVDHLDVDVLKTLAQSH